MAMRAGGVNRALSRLSVGQVGVLGIRCQPQRRFVAAILQVAYPFARFVLVGQPQKVQFFDGWLGVAQSGGHQMEFNP